MQSIPLITHAWELHQAGRPVAEVACQIGKHRATIFRWFRKIKRLGIRAFIRKYESAKKGRRQKRKTDPITKLRIYAIRKQYHQCCGEKIQYWMKKKHGQIIAISTIYRILGQKYVLRSKWKKNVARGPVPKAHKEREVIQSDTVDFGGLFAFTSVDIFTKEAQVVMKTNLDAIAGAEALREQMNYFKFSDLLQRDGGPEFKATWNEIAKHYANRIRTARPYKKNEQSYIESFNRTLRKECLGWRKYKKSDLQIAQTKVNEFITFYNTERPHLSLNLQSPIEFVSHLR